MFDENKFKKSEKILSHPNVTKSDYAFISDKYRS